MRICEFQRVSSVENLVSQVRKVGGHLLEGGRERRRERDERRALVEAGGATCIFLASAEDQQPCWVPAITGRTRILSIWEEM